MRVSDSQMVLLSSTDALEPFQQGPSFTILDHGCRRRDIFAHSVELHDIGVGQSGEHGNFNVELFLGFGCEFLRRDTFHGHLSASPEGHVDHGHGSGTNPASAVHGIFHFQVLEMDLFAFGIHLQSFRHLLCSEHPVVRVSHLLQDTRGFYVGCTIRVFHRRSIPRVFGVRICTSLEQHVHDVCLSFGRSEVQQCPSIVIRLMDEFSATFQHPFESSTISFPTRPQSFCQVFLRRPSYSRFFHRACSFLFLRRSFASVRRRIVRRHVAPSSSTCRLVRRKGRRHDSCGPADAIPGERRTNDAQMDTWRWERNARRRCMLETSCAMAMEPRGCASIDPTVPRRADGRKGANRSISTVRSSSDREHPP
mmetsp:Transcript_9907/g.60433  ORF Transcript_9907/g.60433 Transcript_9907/m.60433 type:complete len:366 (+) Transcript_9907:2221-3318(+)